MKQLDSEADCLSPCSTKAINVVNFTLLSVHIVHWYRDTITLIVALSCSIFINFFELSSFHSLLFDASFSKC
jgi:hypothetical protein